MFLMAVTPGLAEQQQWQHLEKIFGRSGTTQEDMFKLTFPRTDLNIQIGNTSVQPGLGLTSWIGFKQASEKAIMMGDLVLTVREAMPVIKRITAEGIDITGFHNHLTGTNQEIMYLHFSGYGDPVKLADAMRRVLGATATPIGPQQPASEEKGFSSEFSTIQSVLGAGKEKAKILQYSFPRREKVTENGIEISPFIGTANAVNFEIAADGKTATTGDFVLIAQEVNPVITALTENGITVTAVHNHMLDEMPRLFFLHFWGEGEPGIVAKGIKAALVKINLAKPVGK